jgi:hypothetical protein
MVLNELPDHLPKESVRFAPSLVLKLFTKLFDTSIDLRLGPVRELLRTPSEVQAARRVRSRKVGVGELRFVFRHRGVEGGAGDVWRLGLRRSWSNTDA